MSGEAIRPAAGEVTPASGAAVRPATLADVEEIAAIHVLSWQAAYQGLMPQEYLDGLDPVARATRRRRHLEALDWSRGGVLVVTADARIAGFAVYGPTRDEDGDPARTGELAAIYLRPDAWGRRLGQQLNSAAVQNLTAAGYRDATLWVLKGNARARRFYSRVGWAPDGAAKTDDSDGFPLLEVRYRRPLP